MSKKRNSLNPYCASKMHQVIAYFNSEKVQVIQFGKKNIFPIFNHLLSLAIEKMQLLNNFQSLLFVVVLLTIVLTVCSLLAN